MVAQAAIALVAPLGVPLADQAISASAFVAVSRLVTVAQLRPAPVPEVVAIFVYLVDSILWSWLPFLGPPEGWVTPTSRCPIVQGGAFAGIVRGASALRLDWGIVAQLGVRSLGSCQDQEALILQLLAPPVTVR